MQISRHLLMTCAVATFLTPTLVHAYDNESQIRARQALEEKMNQIGAQTAPSTSAPPAAVVKPEPKPAPAPAVTAAPAAPAAPGQRDKMRQALEEKMKEIGAQTPPETSTPPAKANPAPKPVVSKPKPAVSKPQPPVVTVKPKAENPPAKPAPAFAPEISQPATPTVSEAPAMQAPSVTAPSTDKATSDRLSNALHQKMSETAAEPVVVPPAPPARPMPTAPAARPVPSAPATASAPSYAPIPEASNANRPALPETPTPQAEPMAKQNQQSIPPTVSLPQLSGPPSSLSAAKQQKLDALLQQYRLDQLTPQQYHEQRAKILSEP